MPKRKALYTVLISSGIRIGETLGLKKRDFDFSQERVCITIPAILTKKNHHPNGKHYAEHENKTCKVANCPKCFESWINRKIIKAQGDFQNT